MSNEYSLDAEEIPRAEGDGFEKVVDAESAVEALWDNAVAVVKQAGKHKPVLFVFEAERVMMVAVSDFFETAEGRVNFMQFVHEIASTRPDSQGVVLAMEAQYLEIGMVGQDTTGTRSLVVMAEWRNRTDFARKAEIIEDGDELIVGLSEVVPERGLHEFGGVYK